MYMQSQSFNISLPKDLVKRADTVAKKNYKNRSELIRDALRVYVERLERWNGIFEEGRKIGAKMGIKSEEDVNRIIKEYRSEKRKNQSSL